MASEETYWQAMEWAVEIKQRAEDQMHANACEASRPFYFVKPKLSADGNQFCFLYGDNIMEGVAGFGSTPDLASRDFDKNWLSYTIKVPHVPR